ncbi:MAG: radical SAM protein [Nitrospirota bacterium]
MILVHPPVSKPGEPPAGIARLSGALKFHGIKHTLLDANLEGLLYLLKSPKPDGVADVWSGRAFRNLGKNLELIKSPAPYLRMDRYKRVVRDLGRVIEKVSKAYGADVGIANYQQDGLSPLRSADLIISAGQFDKNIFYPYFRTRLASMIHQEQPEWIGFSLNYLSQALCTFAMIGFVKREFPSLKVIIGGGLVTSWLSSPLWRDPFAGLVDHFISGPGEEKLLSLLGIFDKERTYTPDYQALPIDDYFSPGFVLPYSGSTGCYWNRCTFCPEKAEGTRYLPVPPEKVISDINLLKEGHFPVLIHFLDSAVSPSLMEALSDKGPSVPWYGFARVSRQLTEPEFCLSLKRSGCVMLQLGIESGDQTVLDNMEKGISIKMASQALKALKKAGIATYVYLIFGTPAETLKSAKKTLEFTAGHCGSIDFLNLAVFNMPVCGAASNGLDTRKFYDADLSLYTDFTHPAGWDRKQVRQFLENEFKKHPSISAILKNDPPVFTSNHAPFFVMEREKVEG